MVLGEQNLIAIIALSLALSCSFENGNTSSPDNELSIPVVSDEVLVIRCAPLFYDNPVDTGQIQHNEVINLIIDQGWDFQVTQGGIFYHILQKGTGSPVVWGDRVSVHYTGYDQNLQPFHSTRKTNKPFEFFIGNVIDGWNDALPLVNEGGRLLLLIPSYKAYGAQGFGDLVAPNQHLIFDIKLLKKLTENE